MQESACHCVQLAGSALTPIHSTPELGKSVSNGRTGRVSMFAMSCDLDVQGYTRECRSSSYKFAIEVLDHSDCQLELNTQVMTMIWQADSLHAIRCID